MIVFLLGAILGVLIVIGMEIERIHPRPIDPNYDPNFRLSWWDTCMVTAQFLGFGVVVSVLVLESMVLFGGLHP